MTVRATIVGAGGLGGPLALSLGAAGIELAIVDPDLVEISNLHRQIHFTSVDVGKPKATVLAGAVVARGGSAKGYQLRWTADDADDISGDSDLIVDGSDDPATKFAVADWAVRTGRPYVIAAAVRYGGNALAGAPGHACYRCLFEDLPRDNPPNCAEAGVIGPMVGVVGAVQADLALRLLEGDDVAGTLFTFDARTRVHRRRTIQKRAGCMLCDTGGIREVDASRYTMTACAAEDA